jgi:uncharacterized protein
MLQFDLSPLVGARLGERLVFSLDEGPQRLEDISVVFLRGGLTFTRIQEGILVEGEVETQIEVECARCLVPFPFGASLELEEIIAINEQAETTFSLTDEGWFELSPLLREQAWVALPISLVCSEDCRGLCPSCGSDLNEGQCDCRQEQIDPRLAALASLLTEDQ